METTKKTLEFRLLTREEIDVRVGQFVKDKSSNNVKGATFLLYKNARVDMAFLDEVVGVYGWQREHKELKGNIYCGVSIKDPETAEWLTKWDAGKESNTEPEKGEASDSFKRACVNWGIGRELYTAPFIYLEGTENDLKRLRLYVQKIEYSEQREIICLVLVDQNGKQRFSYSKMYEKQQPKNYEVIPEYEVDNINAAIALVNNIRSLPELRKVGRYWKQTNPTLFEKMEKRLIAAAELFQAEQTAMPDKNLQ